jgi:MFS family permease
MLCGTPESLTEIVLFRALQGLFGASLVPLSQATILDIFPPARRGQAMAIWVLGVVVGPVLGPTLGGYLTDFYNWRWVFYINLPFRSFAFRFAPATLRQHGLSARGELRPVMELRARGPGLEAVGGRQLKAALYRALIPASAAIPTATAEKQHDDNDDQKSCGVHSVLRKSQGLAPYPRGVSIELLNMPRYQPCRLCGFQSNFGRALPYSKEPTTVR